MLNNQDIKKFQKLYKKRFGITVNYKEAHDKALMLLNLYKTIYQSNYDKSRVKKLRTCLAEKSA